MQKGEDEKKVLAARVVQLEAIVRDKENNKETQDLVTASKVLTTMAEVFPWVKKDAFDKTRGFPTTKNPSPKMIIPMEIENSWLAEPPTTGTDTHGYFPAGTKFPTSDKFLVPKDDTDSDQGSSKNWPNVVPFEFEDPKIHKFLSANSMVQNSKIQLDPEIFEPSFIAADPQDNFHVIDCLSRKTVTEVAIVDHIIGECKARIIQKLEEMKDPNHTIDFKSELSLYANMLEIGYSANLRARHTATATLVNNKQQGRKRVLDRCVGQSLTKQVMQNSSHATPDLFGPPPESLLSRLHSALGNKNLSYSLRPLQTVRKFPLHRSPLQRTFWRRYTQPQRFKRKSDSPTQQPQKRFTLPKEQRPSHNYSTSKNEFFHSRGSKRRGRGRRGGQ